MESFSCIESVDSDVLEALLHEASDGNEHATARVMTALNVNFLMCIIFISSIFLTVAGDKAACL